MLKIENLSFRVEEEGVQKDILKDITVELPDNAFICVTGPNGGGKSTLARMIAGVQ